MYFFLATLLILEKSVYVIHNDQISVTNSCNIIVKHFFITFQHTILPSFKYLIPIIYILITDI